MKKIVKRYAVCLTLLIVLTILQTTSVAKAEEFSGASNSVTASGVTATLTLDQESYRAGEAINYSLKIENNRERWNISKFVAEYTNSEGLAPTSRGSMPTDIPKIVAGESYELYGQLGATQKLYDKALASQQMLDEQLTNEVSDDDRQNADNSIKVEEQKTDKSIPIYIIICIAAAVVVIALIAVIVIKKKKGGRVLSVVLVFFILTGSVGVQAATPAGAETVTLRPYVQVMYGGEEVTVRVILKFNMSQDKLEIDAQYVDKAATVTCHDPSIFKDFDGTYYIFGTHMGFDSSTDLRNWTNHDTTFRMSFPEEQRKLIREWNKDSGNWYGYLWAPDVIYNPAMDKYCMYLSANGDDWKSNIVMLTADKAEGPYSYAGSVVYGGFVQQDAAETDVFKVLGTDTLPDRYIKNGIANKKWGDKWPNCIDPCVFFDNDGRLWMSYGSWSGGIFMLALDAETGLRDYNVTYENNAHSDEYFGKKIAGGCYVSGEGSYIQQVGNYYYLFMSYGNLEANGGYNVRVFRSSTPDGDYVDALGNSALYDKYEFNYNQSIGVRLFGAYKWRNFNVAQVAQGHNSAFVDDDGRIFIIYHTRTSDGTEGHHVEVHQMFVNKEGWLVAAPYHTNGEILNYAGSSVEDIAGTYEIILHQLDVDYKNRDCNTVKRAILNADGTVTGEYEGTWSKEQNSPYITLVLDGVTYSGVELDMKIENTSLETKVFTALGIENQLTLWGSKAVD